MELTKGDFFDKLNRSRARSRSGVIVTTSQYDEWVKQGLAPSADRLANQGRSPQYRYGTRHYRRALQLARFYGVGIRDRDALLVQLFLRGYGIDPHEMREALIKEISKAVAKLRSPVRSAFIDRNGSIPKASEASLTRSLGEQDAVFKRQGWGLEPDETINLARFTMNPPMPSKSLPNVRFEAVSALNAEDDLATLIPFLEGLLTLDESSTWERAPQAIGAATDAEIVQARQLAHATFFKFGAAGSIPELLATKSLDQTTTRHRTQPLHHNREWAATGLGFCLAMIRPGATIAGLDARLGQEK